MGEFDEQLLKTVKHYQECLDSYTEKRNEHKMLHYLQKLYKVPVKVAHLEHTGVGRTVNGLRKVDGAVGDYAKALVAKWKAMVLEEQHEEEEDDCQTDDDQMQDLTDDDSQDETVISTSSSHRKSDSHRTDNNKTKRVKESSSKSDKYNGHSKHRSHKRKSDSSSEDESSKKRPKKSEDYDRHKKIKTESEEEYKVKERKHKSEKHKSDSRYKAQESSSNDETSHKSSKSKEKVKESSKEKEKHKSNRKDDSKRHEHSSKTKDGEKRKDKEKGKEKSDDKKIKKNKPTGGLTGIDSGSGASFAEALGMCEPSSSKSASKKKNPEKKEKEKEKEKEKTPTKGEDLVPKLLLKEPPPTPEPLDINLTSLLPPITPNYRPLGNFPLSESHHKKFLSESETLSNIISSKNQRTKVYSGNKCGNGKVSSLFELCIRILQDNIDALEYTGGVPYNILKPILEKATPNQLYMMEHHNPYIIEDSDELWGHHCQKEFRNKKREEMETWREMYLRCLDERDAKLKALTANIKQAQDKSLPVRMTKLAYVETVAKPPRNIARKQMKNGTAFDVRKPSMTATAKLSSLATAGEAGKVAVPNPGSRAVERSGGHATKPKKAPLMLKSISSFKNRFKR